MPLDARADSPFVALEMELRDLLRRAPSYSTTVAKRIHPDLEASAYPILAYIDINPGIRGSDLAQHFGVGRATISRQLAKLHELGLIGRETDPEDSRGQLLTLTSQGEQTLHAANESRIAAISHALSHWDHDDVASLAALLHQYSLDLEQWIAAGRPAGENTPPPGA